MSPAIKQLWVGRHSGALMFLLQLLPLIFCQSAFSSELPIYGVESTVTNDVLTELRTIRDYDLFKRTGEEVAESGGRQLGLFPERFPRQYAVFRSFVEAAFRGLDRPPALAHKSRYPSYLKVIAPDFWIRYQFELQALEMQATPSTIFQFLSMADVIDANFFDIGKPLQLRPERAWGMGHIHEGLGRGYPVERPEILRNRVVEELNEAYFWTLVGPDVEAGIHWELYPEKMNGFREWLKLYDRWILEPPSSLAQDAANARSLEIINSVLESPVFSRADAETKRTLIKLASFTYDPPVSEHRELLQRSSFGLLMKLVFLQVFSGLVDERFGPGTIGVRQQLNDVGNEVSTLEFRRIPAHRNAREAAKWMRLLQGRWQLARQRTEVLPLVWPRKPTGKHEEAQLFRRYICEAGMSPLDFVAHLEPELAGFSLWECGQPRWTEICESILASGS